MDITEIRVFPVEEDRLKAYVTITLDNCFVVRDLKIIHGNNGLFVAMPSKKRKDGTFKDIAHPLNSDTRDKMEEQILAEFEKELKRLGREPIDRNSAPPHVGPNSGGYDDGYQSRSGENSRDEEFDDHYGSRE